MRHIRFFLLLFIATAGILPASAQDRAAAIRQKLLDPQLEEVLVVAHRGDWRNAPENSLAAIRNAISMGADIIEIDVQRTKDGELVLLHDKTLDRTTTGHGQVNDWTLDSLRTLRLKNGAGIRTRHHLPTLEEALYVAKGHALLNLDKAYDFFDEVYNLLEKTGTTDHIIMKGNKPAKTVRKQFGQYLDNVLYMPIVNLDQPDAMDKLSEFLSELRPPAFELLYKSDTNPLPRAVTALLRHKSLIWYNTLWDTMAGGHDDDQSLDDPDSGYGYLIDNLGARIIQTDRPAYLIRYLQQRATRGKPGKPVTP